MSDFISFLALIISAITAVPVYRHYLRKAEKTILTVTDNKVENGIIKLRVVYSNVEYEGIIITNSFIMLTSPRLINTYTNSNDVASKVWMEPIVFTNKENKSLILEYELPELSNIEFDNVNIKVKTYYIDSKGKNKCDDFNVGLLVRTDNGVIVSYVEHVGHILSGKDVLASFK